MSYQTKSVGRQDEDKRTDKSVNWKGKRTEATAAGFSFYLQYCEEILTEKHNQCKNS